MSWESILKRGRGKRKLNMDHLRKIVEHLLDTMPGKEFALKDFEKMVLSTYKYYNSTQRVIGLGSILGQMLQNRGYEKFLKYYKGGGSIVHYRKSESND